MLQKSDRRPVIRPISPRTLCLAESRMKFGDYLKCHYIFTVGQLKNATPQVVQKLRSRLTDAANINLKYFFKVAAEIDSSVEIRQTVVSIQGLCRDKSFVTADTDVCDVWWIISPVDALDEPVANKQASDAQQMNTPALMTHDPSDSRISGFEHVPDMDHERVRGLVQDKTCVVASTRIDAIKWFFIPTSTMVAEFKPRPQKPIPLIASPMELWQFEVQTHETIRELYLDRLNINFNSSSINMDDLVVTFYYEEDIELSVFLRHAELVKAQCPILEIYKFEYEVTGRSVEICDLPRESMCCRGCTVM